MRNGSPTAIIWTAFIVSLTSIGAGPESRFEPKPAVAGDLPLVLHDDFERDAPDGWDFTDASAWRIAREDGNRVLEQHRASKYEPSVRSPFNIALAKTPALGDFVMDLKVRSTTRDYGHRDLCLFFGHQDPSHFYYVHLGKAADAHANSIFLVNGKPRVSIAESRTKGTPWTDAWHHVRVVRKVDDGLIQVYFDDMSKPAMIAHDTTFTHGRVGVGSFDDTGRFDAIQVWGATPKTSRASDGANAPLFNGKDLTGWHGAALMDPRKLAAMSEAERARSLAQWTEEVRKHWSVADGVLVSDGEGPLLTTDAEFGDIELVAEFQVASKGESAILLRGTPRIQIGDSPSNASKGSGGLSANRPGAPGRDPLARADRPAGEWNRLRIVQVGARTTVVLNDRLVVAHATMENAWDPDHPLSARGPIQLEPRGSVVRWRNLAARSLSADEANALLAGYRPSGFVPIFDGKTLEGWAGPVNNYEVTGGAIRCRPKTGGTIYYNKEYADFAARVEFRLPPGGNNGLAIRYPGKGDTAYVGMCELQVLDNNAPQYAKLDPRQYHGSAYGMVAAARGYLRPVGQWNFQEVTVRGSTVKVELNGTVILDADLSKVTTFMANSPHPGKDRRSGFFGFAGHGDAVEFRNVAIKTLD